MIMVNGKFVKKCLAVASAAVLVVSVVAGDYCTTYAAVAPSIEVGEGLSYLFEMLSSSLGASVSKAAVPSLYLAVDAYSKTSDPAYMAQLREYYEDDALVRSEPIDTGFCNWLLGAIKDVFVSSGDYGTDVTEYTVPVYGGATYFDVETRFSFTYTNGGVDSYDVVAPSGVYLVPICGDKAYNVQASSPKKGICIYLVSGSPFSATVNSSAREASNIKFLGSNAYCVNIHVSSMDPSAVDKVFDLPYPWIPIGYNPVASDTVDVSIYIDKALAAIQAQALVKTPAITAPISVPADSAAMEDNAKAVAAADNADALYKALAAAGIAIDIGIDVPDETDKPTDAEIPDDGSVSVGKSLSDILAAITGLADKVAAIPSDIAAFFTPDMTAVSESFDSLKDSLMLKFGGLLQLADVFNRSYKFDTVIPVIKIPIPDNETLRTIFDQKTELVILDLTPFASDFQNFRSLLTAMLYVAFAFWFLDEFDVKIHIG